jgi:glutamate racemase
MNNLPIGVFDSGIGGLTVVSEIIKQLPNEEIIYLGDTARVPYGFRSPETVISFSRQNVEFLLKQNVKCVVIACNTSSAYAFESLKKEFEIPIFDVVSPIVEKFKKDKKYNTIGVIGTRGTINSHIYSKNLSGLTVYESACPLFVPLVEEGEVEGRIIDMVADKYLAFFDDKNLDALIIGCTHYPLITRVISKRLPNVELVNPAYQFGRVFKKYLKAKGMVRSKKSKPKNKYYLTDITESFVNTAKTFLGKEINPQRAIY